MNNNRNFLLLALVIFTLAFGVLTVLFWSYMTDKILIPVYHLLWVCSLIINSIPQHIFMALLVVLSVAIGLRTLKNLNYDPYRQPAMYNQSSPATRYQHWRILCTYAHGTWYSKTRLASESCMLILSILASEQGVDSSEAEELVRNGMVDIPDVLRDVIVLKHIPDTSSSRLPRILSWLNWRKADTDPYIDQFLAELINFVENHLEMMPYARNEFES